MSKNQDKIENRIWAIANKLRNKIEPDEFKSYCLGFVFYKFLSEKQNLYADEILKNDKRKFLDLNLKNKNDEKLIKIIEEESISNLGYHLNIEDLFLNICKKIANGDFILDTISKIFRKIENSTKGTESEESFEGLFDNIDLTSRKLGKSEEDKNKLISDILLELDKIEFSLVDYNQDILGDVYEYLISQFASSAGKKAGEFYTPQQVSKILSSITLGSVKNAKEVYDPTCGSGSLLLGLLREDKKIKSCYGQESTGTTYNLCKMNMILNGLHYRRFNIKHDDTLEKPQHMDKEFDIIVSNPPFSSKWKPNASLINDIRFKPYGVLAPDSKADYAFVAHMLHHLKRDGIMCVILSRGSLYREGVETNLKKALIEKYNYLDGIIGLPKNIFYISKAPTCILIFKKNRKTNEKIIFIEAAKLYKKAPKRNLITDEHISQITDIYLERKEIKKLSKNIDKKEIFENNFNLNISKYIDGTVELPNQDIKKIILDFKKNNELYNQNEKELFKICEKLKLPFPDTNNVNLLYNYKEAFRNDLFNKKINLGENIKWGDLNLSDLLKETFQKTIDKNEEIYSVSVHKGLVNQIEHLGRSFAAENTLNYNLVKPGDIVYTRSPTGEFPFGVIKQSKIYKSVLVSPLYGVYKPSTIELGNIIDFYFELKENAYNYLHSIVNIGPKNTISISSDVFLSKKITVPEDTEIIKLISLFINLLNKKINLIYEKN